MLMACFDPPGATIHTMNGLQMRVRTVSEDEPLPKAEGYWTQQHLKRGLSANGMPLAKEEDAQTQANRLNMELTIPMEIKTEEANGATEGGCPMHRP
jgi:hypothetical protein